MIIKGKFQVLSLAVYGEIVSEILPVPDTYEPTPLPSLPAAPLPKSVDPANAADPTQLARALLMLIPDSPPLHLVIRLIFCLKPAYDDWDDPKFPYHNDTNLQTDTDFSLERAWKMIETPIRDNISEELISSFSERVAGLLGGKVCPPALSGGCLVTGYFRAYINHTISLNYLVYLHLRCLRWGWLYV